MPRPYRLRRRAERMAETRRRIAHAAVELHASVGPRATTIAAIARGAGVERRTVYQHFPDEPALFRACVSHGIALWPLPEPSRWRSVRDRQRRLRLALDEVYAYYERTEPMWTNVTRDFPLLPALVEANAAVFARWAQMRRVLVAGRGLRGRRRHLVEALVGHFLAFQTWRSLARDEGLARPEVIEIAAKAIRVVSGA